MKHRKCVKLLMGIGIQRNDAAAFARVYSKIILQGHQHYFPFMAQVLLSPEPPIAKRPLQTAMFQASCYIDSYKEQQLMRNGDLSDYIRKQLCYELVKGLEESEALKVERVTYNSWIGDVRYQATLRMILPEDKL